MGWLSFGCADRRRRGTGTRLRREQFAEGDELGGEVASFEEDGEASIKRLVDGDGSVGIAEATGAGENLEDDLSESDGVVFGDDAVMFKAEDGIKFSRAPAGAIGRLRALGNDGKATVEAAKESGEEGIGLVDGADIGQL